MTWFKFFSISFFLTLGAVLLGNFIGWGVTNRAAIKEEFEKQKAARLSVKKVKKVEKEEA